MKNHLQSKHPDKLSKIYGVKSSTSCGGSRTVRSLRSFANTSAAAQPASHKQLTLAETVERKEYWDINDAKSKQYHYLIGEMIALDNEPLSMVDRVGFNRLMHKAVPRYKISSNDTLFTLVFQQISVAQGSKLASELTFGRTKAHAIVTNVTGKVAENQLIEILQKNKFSLIVDESTDRSSIKHLALIVRTAVDFHVEDSSLCLIPVVDGTATALHNACTKHFEEKNIPYKENMVGFAADGTNSMFGQHHSLSKLFAKDIPNLFLIKCICHSFHLCASYACKKLPRGVEDFARDVYNYIQNSPKRIGDYKEFQCFVNIKPHKLLHPAQTRYLASGCSFKEIHYSYRVGVSTISKLIKEMTHVIWENLKTDFLKLPDTEREWEDIASGFERKANFPHCLGAVDGKHIRDPICNKVPRKGVQCAAEIYLLFEADTEAVLLYSTDCEHNHDSVKKNYHYGICDETKSEINKLYDLHLKPKSILENLKKNSELKIPTKRQLYNYLADRRRIKYGPSTISQGELEKWIVNHTNVPDNENEVFVIAYYILESDPPSFRIVLSTKNFLKQCISADILHADATYKSIWQGYPVLIVGTTDNNRKFHPICLTVSTNECAAPISPAANNALESFNRVIKDHNTLCERIPLARFLVVAEEMVNNWSVQATEEKFATQPQLQLSDWTTGYQWAKTDTKIRVVHSTPASTTYLIPFNNSFKIDQAEKTFRCFDEYKKVFFSSWNVILPNNQTEWITGYCDCPDFYRKYSCKHLIGLAIRLKYVTPPLKAKSQPLGLKRKRRKPTKARAAFIIQ
ncbi:unnamed protein product [Leptosia nina]|uniref:SWIM-type domain-containing protein n=1 Tax=Leptosia nina TaxID=320188 RepID=A0AAV1J0S7_9NEOP